MSDHGQVYVYEGDPHCWYVEDYSRSGDSSGFAAFKTKEEAVREGRYLALVHGLDLTICGGAPIGLGEIIVHGATIAPEALLHGLDCAEECVGLDVLQAAFDGDRNGSVYLVWRLIQARGRVDRAEVEASIRALAEGRREEP